eukprot:Nk52_evm5s281 gene=Nk52_evmTU5s281
MMIDYDAKKDNGSVAGRMKGSDLVGSLTGLGSSLERLQLEGKKQSVHSKQGGVQKEGVAEGKGNAKKESKSNGKVHSGTEKGDSSLKNGSGGVGANSIEMNTSSGSEVKVPQDTIVVHVCDEAKRVNRDFVCKKSILLEEVKYFAEYLNEKSKDDEVEISVHCDLHIFDWLMKYVHRKDIDALPELDVNNAVSILISSEFLKMDKLVSECLYYIRDHLSDILMAPLDLSCISPKIAKRIAVLVSHDDLFKLKHSVDDFFIRLLKIRISELCNRSSGSGIGNSCRLFKCMECQRILDASLCDKVKCTRSNMAISLNGAVVGNHIPDPRWDINSYVADIFANGDMTWYDIYWRIWSFRNAFECSVCEEWFLFSEYNQCRYHPGAIAYVHSEDDQTVALKSTVLSGVGIYPCCEEHEVRFSPSTKRSGCCKKKHKPKLVSDLDKSKYEDLNNNFSSITTSFPSERDMNVEAANSQCSVFVPEEIITGVHVLQQNEAATPRSTPVAKPAAQKKPPKGYPSNTSRRRRQKEQTTAWGGDSRPGSSQGFYSRPNSSSSELRAKHALSYQVDDDEDSNSNDEIEDDGVQLDCEIGLRPSQSIVGGLIASQKTISGPKNFQSSMSGSISGLQYREQSGNGNIDTSSNKLEAKLLNKRTRWNLEIMREDDHKKITRLANSLKQMRLTMRETKCKK